MSPLTLFLAKLIGSFLVIVAAALAARKQTMIETANAIVRDRGLVLLIGSIRIGAGLAIVLSHNLWSGGLLTVLVTLLGWTLLLRGMILWFTPPSKLMGLWQAIRFEEYYYAYVGSAFLLGFYLAIAGFAG